MHFDRRRSTGSGQGPPCGNSRLPEAHGRQHIGLALIDERLDVVVFRYDRTDVAKVYVIDPVSRG